MTDQVEQLGSLGDADVLDRNTALSAFDVPAVYCDPLGLIQAVNEDFVRLVRATSATTLIGGKLDIVGDSDGGPDRLVCTDGGNLPVRVVPLPAESGENQGRTVLLIALNPTAPVPESSVQDELRRLRDVQIDAGIGSFEYRLSDGVGRWSPGLFVLHGLDPDGAPLDFAGIVDMLHPDDRERLIHLAAEQAERLEDFVFEYRVQHLDGRQRRLLAKAAITKDADGVPDMLVGFAADVTEQRTAAEALAEERAWLLEAQRIARLGSFTLDESATARRSSEVLREKLLELTGQDEKLLTAVHPEDRDLAVSLLDKVDGLAGEVELRDRSGTRRYACRIRAELDADGKVIRRHGTVQDVTAQRELEAELRAERRRLFDAERGAGLGFWSWDPGSDRVSWSPVLREIFGVDEDLEITYQRYLEGVHPEDRTTVEALWHTLLIDKQPSECEHRVVRGDGTIRVVRCTGAITLEADGSPRVVGITQDLTGQRAVEAKVRTSTQRFADLVSIAPIGIGIFDDQERMIDANEALCDLLGYELDQLRGMSGEQLTHPQDRQARERSVARVAQSEAKMTKVPQRLLVRADGEPVYCELHVSRSEQDDGRLFWLIIFQDITERRRAAEALRHQATHDDLTGLPNRAAVKEQLAGLLSGPDGSRVAVLFCDIDNFKRVNDSLGHDAGDELLVALARRLEGGLPPSCTASRLSGDEYVVICSDIDAVGGVDALATRVAGLLRTAVPVHGQLVRVSASIGAAVPNGSRASGADLLRFADAAMFEAKREGAGRVALASAALMASADRQVHLEGQLREALSRDELILHYQPVVGPDGAVQTAEALVRWPHPERGLLAPDVFLPVAEQGDLLRDLDRWVLRTALREASTWPTVDGRQVAVAVNLAGLVPGVPDFVDSVTNAVEESGIDWNQVILELVETSLVDLPSRTRQTMGELVERGVRFAVDDFGTGYSSLARLKDLPAQIIKVDRRFVAGVGNDPSDFAVARAVVDMARAMDRSCVAEGVETATQFHVLRGVGVDAYQGWLFSRPVPAKEFRSVLALGPLHVPRAG
ncbi:sensor domain-containing protein [Actinoalloteichus hymeniacidonis]|uniref:PAS domain S-box/diguanylate cyclase (GGDEF) domain-containing protein n=1 Tax=Actinoalloteichus hymeniacidonis TaxID=340345 RepID=A0AAC9HUW4_9PSEU|nr:EAL domain-containing protein [Actinoalloteichus hymeniacidonis]AOS65406.1 PAS domain S-box/diguanylate cyclase (GGDEF) domain-containing protein [Actinoalloteichus hymeniacidonis]MBB5906508.1 diguanylate cyclase (GGDEF)-like protein/PAS domain S-box-containing protein [Actinoalloteichus hymeniacidonis]